VCVCARARTALCDIVSQVIEMPCFFAFKINSYICAFNYDYYFFKKKKIYLYIYIFTTPRA
jgi:hypothetical protein